MSLNPIPTSNLTGVTQEELVLTLAEEVALGVQSAIHLFNLLLLAYIVKNRDFPPLKIKQISLVVAAYICMLTGWFFLLLSPGFQLKNIFLPPPFFQPDLPCTVSPHTRIPSLFLSSWYHLVAWCKCKLLFLVVFVCFFFVFFPIFREKNPTKLVPPPPERNLATS